MKRNPNKGRIREWLGHVAGLVLVTGVPYLLYVVTP